jgi:hypothetical protein
VVIVVPAIAVPEMLFVVVAGGGEFGDDEPPPPPLHAVTARAITRTNNLVTRLLIAYLLVLVLIDYRT